MQPSSHQYYLYINKTCTPWDIHKSDQGSRWFGTYLSRVLRVVDQAVVQQGLIFYITLTDVHELPSYGENVIVIVVGDEFYRIPRYVDKVGAIFKCDGYNQLREQAKYFAPLLKPSYLKVSMLGQYFKNLLLHRAPLKLNYGIHKLKGLLLGRNTLAPLFDIQLGYSNSDDLPIKSMSDRTFDVFFDGSVDNYRYPVWRLRHWAKPPKAISREQMITQLRKFQRKHSDAYIKLSRNSEYNTYDGEAANESYSENMMNSKICIAPRGTTYETYRHFEAMRYGCIIVTEPLPDRWYFAGAPVVEVSDWRNLGSVLRKLLDNPTLMQELHERTLEHWRTKCSEAAAGHFIAENLNCIYARRRVRSLAVSSQRRVPQLAAR